MHSPLSGITRGNMYTYPFQDTLTKPSTNPNSIHPLARIIFLINGEYLSTALEYNLLQMKTLTLNLTRMKKKSRILLEHCCAMLGM